MWGAVIYWRPRGAGVVGRERGDGGMEQRSWSYVYRHVFARIYIDETSTSAARTAQFSLLADCQSAVDEDMMQGWVAPAVASPRSSGRSGNTG